MEGERSSIIAYLMIASMGFLVGLAFGGFSTQRILTSVLFIGAILFFIYAVRMDQSAQHMNMKKDEQDSEQILSPDEARQWLDDFLAKQQQEKSNL